MPEFIRFTLSHRLVINLISIFTLNNMNYLQNEIFRLNNQTEVLFNYLNIISPHVGEYKWSYNSNDNHGWLKCDGRFLSSNNYPQLFNIIGFSFGSNSSGLFNIPDFRGYDRLDVRYCYSCVPSLGSPHVCHWA